MSGKQSLAKKNGWSSASMRSLFFTAVRSVENALSNISQQKMHECPLRRMTGFTSTACGFSVLWKAMDIPATFWMSVSVTPMHRERMAFASCAPRDGNGNFSPIRSSWLTRASGLQMYPIVELTWCIYPLYPMPSHLNSRNVPSRPRCPGMASFYTTLTSARTHTIGYQKYRKPQIYNHLKEYNPSKLECVDIIPLGIFKEDSAGNKLAGLIGETSRA